MGTVDRQGSGAVRGVNVGHGAWASIQRRLGAVRRRARLALRAPSTSTSACPLVAAAVIISAGSPASSSSVAATPRRHANSRALARTRLSNGSTSRRGTARIGASRPTVYWTGATTCTTRNAAPHALARSAATTVASCDARDPLAATMTSDRAPLKPVC
jgi:hypothetical protein